MVIGMGNIFNEFKNIFELKDLVWFLLGIIVPIVINVVRKEIARASLKRRIRNSDSFYLNNFDIELVQPLAHANPFYKREHLKLYEPSDEFHISIPTELHDEILNSNSHFDNVKWEKDDVYFNGQDLEKLYSYIADISGKTYDESKLIAEECRVEVAEMFAARKKEPFFNGVMYGIKSINESRINDSEDPMVEIRSFKSDYYTHRVMARIYQKLHAAGKIKAPRDIRDINELYPFLTGIGMDVIVVINDRQDIVLTKRSEELINMDKSKWHLTMNEAISITDVVNDRIILDQCVKRGLEEELGIVYEYYDMEIKYGDIFVLKNPLEVGITGFVYISNISYDELKACYSTAKDATFESTGNPNTGLKLIHLNGKSISEFYKNNPDEITPACKFTLNMLYFKEKAQKALR